MVINQLVTRLIGLVLPTGAAPCPCRTAFTLNPIPSTPILMPVALMIPLLTVVGLAGFWLFYRSVDFFDRI